MKNASLKLLAVALTLWLSQSSCGTLTDISPPQDELIPIVDANPYYLSSKSIGSFKVDPPPPIHSIADQSYLQALKHAQATRTEGDCKRAQAEANPINPEYQEFFGSMSPFARPIGGEERDFFIHVWSDASIVSEVFKKKYDWPRAYTTDKTLIPCLKKIDSPSFPSTHALVSRTFALVLAEIDPKNSDRYLDRANLIAKDRLLAGMHRPNELKAGQELADQIFAEFLKSKRFTEDLARMRAIAIKNSETK